MTMVQKKVAVEKHGLMLLNAVIVIIVINPHFPDEQLETQKT